LQAATRVPAGAALAVDREKFAELITQRIESEPRIELIRDEVTTTNESDIAIIATGPLTSEAPDSRGHEDHRQ
jgi:NAD(FAD)-utilizing enzyme possibly involved in translation